MTLDMRQGAGDGASAKFQDWLDWMDATILERDYDTYASGVSLPFTLITRTSTILVASAEDLRHGFDSYCDMLEAQGVTEIVRLARRVHRIGDGLMTGDYETHVLKRGAHVMDPFNSTAILRSADGGWQAVAIANEMTNTRWPIDLPRLRENRVAGTGN